MSDETQAEKAPAWATGEAVPAEDNVGPVQYSASSRLLEFYNPSPRWDTGACVMGEGSAGTVMLTRSDRLFDFANLRERDVVKTDIVHSLSMQTRFNGHCRVFYSVAEHSVLVADIVWKRHKDARLALVALYHDAHEAYTGDMPTPLKAHLGYPLKELEYTLDALIARACDVPTVSWEAYEDYVKPADNTALAVEFRDLHDSSPCPYRAEKEFQVLALKPAEAYEAFLSAERYYRSML